MQERFEFVRARFGTKSHKGLLSHWNAVGSRYLFSGVLRCGVCGANMNIVSGTGKRGYSKYGCPMYHFRGSCSNGLTERSDLLEEKLLKSLRDAVLQQEVVDYTLQRFEEELRAKLESLSVELESVRRRKRILEAEVTRLTEGLATAEEDRAPAAVIAAIHKREQELRAITDKLVEAQPGSLDAKLKDIRRFVVSRLADVRGLLNSDIPTAKAELLRHVERIDLLPAEENGKPYFEAVGEWNLLGGYPSTKSGGAGGRSRTADASLFRAALYR